MKRKIKILAIVLCSILLIVLSGIAVTATTYENKSTVGNTVNDANKTKAVLNNSNILTYTARDIATYNNLYCVAHNQSLDGALVYYENNKFEATAMADIRGNTATFYTRDSSGKLTQSKGSVTCDANKVMAGIFAEENPNSLVGISNDATNRIYKGYGAVIPKSNSDTYEGYNYNYTVIQIAAYKYFDTWIKAIGTDKGFQTNGGNSNLSDIDDWKKTVADNYINKLSSSSKIYNAKIYFLQYKSYKNNNDYGYAETYAIQNLILVEVEDKIEIPVTKNWDDSNNVNGNRPSSIKVTLYANGATTNKTLTLDASNSWKGKFTELDKKDSSGNEINYTIKEDTVTGYKPTISGGQASGFTITNKLETINIPVTKSWDDSNNANKNRPTSIMVTLYENGTATNKTLTLNASNSWKGTFTNLPKYKNGSEITYTVKEDNVTGYTTTISGSKTSGFTIKNTMETINIPVTKNWVDNDNANKNRPSSITVRLYADGTDTNKTLKLEPSSWSGTFTNLPKYNKNGSEIKYTVKEDTVTGYTTTISGNQADGFTITNTLETIDIPVEKKWQDQDNKYGTRPESIVVTLYENGTATDNKLELNASNDWKGTFTNLPKYKNGKEITYTVNEDTVTGYTPDISDNGTNGFTITNTLETIDIPVEKIWDDENDRDGKRPSSITIKLIANSTQEIASQSVTGTGNKWTYTFEGVPKYINGRVASYSITETEVQDYTTEIQGFTIINKHIPERIRVQVTKKWEDENDLDEYRRSIQVTLYGNGTKVTKDADGKTITNPITLSEGNWTYTFENLYRYENKKEIDYTVKEETIEHYNEPNYKKSFTEATDSQTALISWEITNTHVPHYDGYIEISGKVWLDGKAGKDNTINGRLDSNEKGISGIRVTLKNANGSDFTTGNKKYVTETDSKGEYKFLVNYDDSQNVYKLYEDANTVKAKLQNAYVEFEYDGMTYTTVATATLGANTSKAKENETTRIDLDSAHATVTPSTKHPNEWTDKNITAVTKGVISFTNYTDKTTRKSEEVLKYCIDGNRYQRTNPEGAWNNIIESTGAANRIDHTTCNGAGKHTMRTYNVDVEVIQNVNLGLFEREQPELSIISDISKVEVTMNSQKYTYLYGKRAFVENSDLKINYQNKDNNEFKYERPLNPADIAYVKDVDNNAMSVLVTYKVNVANLSSTLPVTVHGIINAYDKDYTVVSIVQNGGNIGYTKTETYGTEASTGFKEITLNKDIKLAPYTQSDDIEITYSISLNAIIGLLQQNATLDNAVEIQSYSTEYGGSTLYAEQRTGGRTGKPYAGYDFEAHPGNAGIYINSDNRLKANKPERDTDIAPSFVLYKDEPKILSGNVWEDSDNITTDDLRLGDGKKSNTEKNLANAKVELLKVKDDETLEPAYLYNLDSNKGKILAVAYSDNNGNYSFGNGDSGYSVVTDRYVMKFTYGEGITKEDGTETLSTINGANVNARNYKSTIISNANENKALYDVFKNGTSDEEWHLKIQKGYSVAVDEMEQRVAIEDLQYSNFGDKINMTAYSKPFKMQVEFDANGESQVGKDGKTTFGNELNVFDFGIIERAREDIYVDKTVSYLKVTLANGQVLTEGNPNQKLNYVKTMGFNKNIENGDAARNALDKQMLIEMDSELIQGAQIEVKYQVQVINNSEKDYDYYVDNQIKTEYYYFGTNNVDKSPVIKSSVKLVDYVGADIADGYTWDNPNNWEKVTADSLRVSGKELICDNASKVLNSNEYVAYVTNIELNPKGEPALEYYATAKKLLANQDENVLENHLEILQIDAKTARTIKETGKTKEYKPGDYVPSLEARTINGTDFKEEAGLHEQDDDRVKVMITNATGVTNYITTYVITGAIGLIVIAVVIVFIKKKVLTK